MSARLSAANLVRCSVTAIVFAPKALLPIIQSAAVRQPLNAKVVLKSVLALMNGPIGVLVTDLVVRDIGKDFVPILVLQISTVTRLLQKSRQKVKVQHFDYIKYLYCS